MAITPITMQYVVDQANNNNFFTINTVQGDGHEARYAEFSITNNGYPYEIPSGARVIVKGTKPDGTGIENDCEVIDTDMIRFEITAQMSAVIGIGTYNISFLTDGEEETVISSFPFYINVTSDTQDPDTVISSDEYQGLVNLMADFQKEQTTLITNFQEEQAALVTDFQEEQTSLVTDFKEEQTSLVTNFQNEQASLVTDFKEEQASLVTDFQNEQTELVTDFKEEQTELINEVNHLIDQMILYDVLGTFGTAITTQPVDATFEAGKVASFSIIVVGGAVTSYQWQVSTDNGDTWTNMSTTDYPSANTNVLSFAVPSTGEGNGNRYRCVVVPTSGGEQVSTSGIMTIYKPEITTQPVDVTTTVGNPVAFTIAAAGTPTLYQWQYSINNSTWANINEAENATAVTNKLQFTATADDNGNRYRCGVTWATGTTTYSNGATLTVNN